ncbi:MAG: phosphatidylserine decarboxylase [Methanosarcinaceae archaeon]|nr:phosphatidylserine decarboxylase [Methanosarcinaceae archaeon]MDD4331498.1 phosphatidylserine decarboxylase [Methanosarcinaceae archaeon]MDD4749701.1 phosphatidylserine decarboxylase [Methanosarcinaceae archaeon]
MLAKGSMPWILGALGFTAFFAGLQIYSPHSINLYGTGIGGSLLLFMLWFFRDPERQIEVSEAYMLAPADGRICDIRGRKVCIFMFLQNVHVNRAPIAGKIKEITYRKGGHIPAFCKDSERNERNDFIIESKYGEVQVTQIAGTIARRIVTYSKKNDIVEQGQRLGMIRFGSRVDVTIPEEFDMVIKKGERVKAGKSIIASLKKNPNPKEKRGISNEPS